LNDIDINNITLFKNQTTTKNRALKKLIATKEKLFENMTSQLAQYQKEYNEVKDLQDLEVKIKAVRNELAWAIVRESDLVKKKY